MIKIPFQSKLPAAALFLVLAANALFLRVAMLGQYDPFDYGAFMDLAWRILCGQRLYVDVITHVQPVFPHEMALFFKLFGYGRTGALAMMIVSSSLMIFAVYSMVHRRAPAYAVFLTIIMTMTGFYWNYPFPTYNQESFLFGTLGVWALASQVPFQTGRRAFWASFACGAAAVFSAMTKINIGAIFGLFFTFVVLAGPQKKAAISGLCAGVAAGLALTLPMAGDLREFLEQNFLYASKQQSRFNLFLNPKSWLVNGYWIPVLTVFIHSGLDLFKSPQKLSIFLGVFLTAIVHYHTSSMFIAAHIPLMGALVGLGWILISEASSESTGIRRILRKLTAPVLIIFCFYQIWQSAAFSYKIAFAKEHPNKDLHREYTLQNEPLKGFQSPLVWGEALDVVPEYVRQHVPKDETLFIMAPLYPVYAITGHDSYRKVTYEFKYGAVPAPGEHVQRVKKAIIDNPPEWILTYKDQSPFPINAQFQYMQLHDFILQNYKIEQSWGAIGLLKKNK